MACVALTSLISTLELEFLQPIPTPRVRLSLHDQALIKSFSQNLSSLQDFLQKECSGALKHFEIPIRDFSLKAEDDILLAQDREYQEKASQELHQTLQQAEKTATKFMKILTRQKDSSRKSNGAAINFALKAEDDIDIQLNNFLLPKDIEHEEEATQELYQTLQEAAELFNSRSIEVDEANETQLSNSWLKHASKSENAVSDGSSQCFLKLEKKMVGRHCDCRVIKDHLFYPCSDKLKLISIVGMFGIGKTTLARTVYGDPSVASHFDVRGWVTIPQDYNKNRMLCNLLQSITPAEPNVIKKESNPDELEMQVCKCLVGKRYLIVLDNILSNQAWIDFIQCVPNGMAGSCILLTTSHFKRDYYHSDYIHNMTLLDPKESWDLFCDTLSIKDHMVPKFEKIRDHVVEKCDGLPELIVEVAKRLSKCNNIQQGWEKIEKELESLGILDRNAFTISYNPLPHHLKVCFLYFGVFPKRKRILVKMIIRLWIAEEFVKPLELKELEDQAYEYLQELIDRSLLLIENQSSNGKIKTCRMHSAMHSFCVGEAQKEGILCAVNTQQHPWLSADTFANSCRWLSLYSHSFDYYVLFNTNIPRSIFFFHENPKVFVPLKLLRVLAFDTSIFLQRVPLHLRDLVFLRYLSITQWFKDLDDVVSNNLNLHTLVVSSNGAPTAHLPSSIWKSPHLRHLELGNSYTVDPPSMVKENLQSLSCVVRPTHCRKEVYEKLPNIKKLKIFLKDDIEPSCTRGSCSNPIILDYLHYLEELEKLTISVMVGCSVALTERPMFPLQLKKLKLSGINLSERDLTVIGMLPQLMVLKLENAFLGTVWKISEGGFHRLRFLFLEDTKLKQWEWEACDYDNFLVLERVVLRFCYSLEQLPVIFADIPTMQFMALEECQDSLIYSATEIQTVQRDWGNDTFEVKILRSKYDEPQCTDTEVSAEDSLARFTLSE